MTKVHELVEDTDSLNKALKKVRKAQAEFANFSQEEVDKIFLAAAVAANQAQ